MTRLPALDIHHLLRQYDLRPSKGLGQNFLVDDHALRQIVSASGLTPTDHVLEIGPGLGSLTRHLARSAGTVTAVEIDPRLFPALTTVLAPFPNIRLIQGDILQLDPASLVESPDYLVVANIPYNITSAIFRHLLTARLRPRRVVLTIQQEVAARICALPGDMSLLALSVQVFGKPSALFNLPATAFHPAPKVDSTVLGVEIYPQPIFATALLPTFFSIARAGFSQKRKMLRNSLSGGLGIPAATAEQKLAASGIDPQRRAETVSLDEWALLCRQFAPVK